MNPDNSLKFQWAIFAVLGLCFMASSALADVTDVIASENEGSMNTGEIRSEVLGPDYFSVNSLSEEFVFEGAGDELLLAANNSYSSTLSERTERSSLRGNIKLDSNYFKGIFTDTGYALTSPWRWDKSDWATASVVAGVTGIFFVLDDDIKEEVQGGRSSTTDDISKFFEPFGNGAFQIPVLAGFYLYGRFGENDKLERMALLATESFLVTGLFNTALKVVTGRPRPSKGESADTFTGFSTSNNSFASGHTSTVFAIATVVANEYEHTPLIALISYGIATMTGFSRLNDNKHWASDVVFGAALGYFTAKTILKLHSNKKGRHFTIYPHADHRGGGLTLSTRF